MLPRAYLRIFGNRQNRLLLTILALALGLSLTLSSGNVPMIGGNVTAPTLPDLGKLPLAFEPNAGQSDPSARFVAHAAGGSALFFAPSEVVLSLPQAADDGRRTTDDRDPSPKSKVQSPR